MKPTVPPLERITALAPLLTRVIPAEYEDQNGHMNMRWYLAMCDDAGSALDNALGLTLEHYRQHGTGGFDLEHHVNYLTEVAVGDSVSIYARLVGRSAKRIHYVMFIVNDTHGRLAAVFECVHSCADLAARQTAPYPPHIAANIDSLLAQHRALDWNPPLCGVMRA